LLARSRQKRIRDQKLQGKTLGELSDNDDNDNPHNWVQQSKKRQQERQRQLQAASMAAASAEKSVASYSQGMNYDLILPKFM
jgi:hypothetical protein